MMKLAVIYDSKTENTATERMMFPTVTYAGYANSPIRRMLIPAIPHTRHAIISKLFFFTLSIYLPPF